MVSAMLGANKEMKRSATGANRSRTRLALIAAAAGQTDAAALVGHVALGLDVDHTCRPIAVLGRECPGEKIELVGKTGIERLAKAGDGLGDHDPIDAILQIGVISTHVKLAEGIPDD